MENEFITWLKKQLDKKGWSMRELSRHCSFSHAHIALVIRGGAVITFEFCASMAQVFGVSPIELFELAGLVNSKQEEDDKKRKLNKLFSELPETKQDDVIQFAEWIAIKND